MGITVTWDDEQKTILRLAYCGPWTNEEFFDAGKQSIEMLQIVNHPVYVINDFSSSDLPPLGALWQARGLSQHRPPNWSGGVAITGDAVIRNLIDIFVHVYMLRGQRDQFVVETDEQALAIIARLKRENQVS